MATVTRQGDSPVNHVSLEGIEGQFEVWRVEVHWESADQSWNGEAIYYEESYYLLGDNIPPSNKGKKTITTTTGNKATIADPGFHFSLDLYKSAPQFHKFLDEKTTKLQVRVYIDVFEDNNQILNLSGENHVVRSLNSSILFTMDGIGQQLDLRDPMRVLIPFVDTRWRKETHHDNVLNYLLHVMVFDNQSFTYDFPLMVGTLKKSQKSSGPFVNGHIPEHLPEGMPWACYSQNGKMITIPNDQLTASPDGKEIRLADGKVINTENEVVMKDIIYTEEGVWFNIHYQGNRPTATYLLAGRASTNFYSPRSSDGQQIVDPYEACFLPYPRVQGFKPLDCIIKVGNSQGQYIFQPPSNHKDTYKSLFLITGSNLPARPGAGDDNSSVDEVAEVAGGLVTRIVSWFRNLFG